MLLAPTLGWLAGPESSSAPELLREPPVLRNTSSIAGVVEVTITATPARIRLLPGGPLVNVYAYNGSVPGPTLELREGDSVIIHFRNRLPEPTTVHWHGVHLPAKADGSPLYPIAPGESHDYTFRLVPRGRTGIIRIPTSAVRTRSRWDCSAVSSSVLQRIR